MQINCTLFKQRGKWHLSFMLKGKPILIPISKACAIELELAGMVPNA